MSGSTGEYTPVTPARILDTRDGTGRGGVPGKIGAKQTIDVPVLGVGGVPSTGVDAVVLNVTVTEPTVASYFTVWPSGTNTPTASNLNFAPNDTRANLVTVKVGANGRVNLYNNGGNAHAIFDVAGWYSTATGPAGSRFHTTSSSRILDTRAGVGAPAGPLRQDGVIGLNVLGVGGVPRTGVTAVVMNVTATEPSNTAYLTVWPSDASRPVASSLNFTPGQTVPNLVTVRVPTNGVVNIFNPLGTVQVVADVVGWYDGNKSTGAGRFVAVSPVRAFDSRVAGGTIQPGESRTVKIYGYGGVPTSGVAAVVANTTVTQPTAPGYLTVYPAGAPRPTASSLNWVPGLTVPNLVPASVNSGSPPTAVFFNSMGTIELIVDIAGYFTS